MEDTHFESLYPKTTREHEIRQLLSFVKEGGSCQVIAVPGVGRGNLLRFLAYNKKIKEYHLGDNAKWFHFVLVDFAEMRSRTLLDTTKFLFLTLVDSLRERRMNEEFEKVNAIFKESLSFNDELVLFQGLKRAIDYLALEKGLTIVYLFDRFEEYVPTVTKDFFTNLRVLRNHAKYRFSVVFSTDKPLEDLLEPDILADYYEFLAEHCIYLSLSDAPGLEFRIEYMEKVTGKMLAKDVIAKITQLTGGHMRLIRMGLESLLTEKSAPEDLENFLLQQKTVRRALSEIWHSLTPSEQKHMELVVQNSPDECDSKLFLEQVGLLRQNKVQIPLFIPFIAEQEKNQKPQDEVVRLDGNTNEILKGEQNLSDMLTASEYRLLRFLLDHENQIVGREEIIDAVWHDSASTAGVTDQALDQLILRVRKKIEDDPKNPIHLQTIKGRGFRFTT